MRYPPARMLSPYTLSTQAVRVLAVEDRSGMPTYEYACKQCGVDLEVVQSFTDDALTVCSNCGGELKKVFGNIGIVFKGSGFYKTDSRSGSSAAKTAATDTSTSTKGETKSEPVKESTTKSDGAPAAATTSSTTPKTAAAS
jgi:putative FmdB family regulatory protein